jgi:branched-chain amino acid transport system substrate-binding protein
MKRWLVLLVLTVTVVAYAGGSAPAAPPQVIKIGILFPLSGPVAATGVASTNAIKLAVEIINDKYPELKLPLAATSGLPNLGGARIELVIADHQMNPELGASETERLITQQGVVAIIGAYASAITETASAAAERLGVPFLNDQSTSPRLHRRGFKWFFRTTPHDEVFSDLMLRFLKELNEKRNLGIKSVATIYENTLFGTDSSRTLS